jgi:hypothetical protein
MGLIMSSVLIGLLRALPGPITGLEIPAEDQSHSTALLFNTGTQHTFKEARRHVNN